MVLQDKEINKAKRMMGWPGWSRSRQYVDWALAQLNVKPYQHLLEIGYGAGYLLEEVARSLKIGYLSGIEGSLPLYELAYRRNKRFVQQQLLQLHIGELHELSYPPHYFHTIYGSQVHQTWKDPQAEIMRLSSLLKNKGKMVLLGYSSENAERLESDLLAAGLSNIRVETRDGYPVPFMAISAYKSL